MVKSPDSSNGLIQGDLFDEGKEPVNVLKLDDQPISPPHAKLVDDFKKSRDQLLTPTREPDIHEVYQGIQTEAAKDQSVIKLQINHQGLSGFKAASPEDEKLAREKVANLDTRKKS